MPWFGAHFPRLGIEIFEHRDAAWPGRSAVLVDGELVRLANASARAAGIAPGSTLVTALGIAGDLRHFDRDAAGERDRLHGLAEAASRYTPRVSLSEPDGLVLDARASLRLFGGAAILAAALAALFRRARHEARIAAAHTPAAALALARAGRASGIEDSPDPGQVAARSLAALRDTPLECAEIEAGDAERLAAMGIRTLGQLLALPRDELGMRFGPALPDYLARLAGEAPDPRRSIIPRERFASSLHFVEPVSNAQTLLFPMRRLATDLGAWLRGRGLGSGGLRWRFQPLHGAGCEIEVRFAAPRIDPRGMLDLSRLRLEGVALPEEVTSLHLSALDLAPRASEPGELFGVPPGVAGAGVRGARAFASPAALVERLAARLGGDALRGLSNAGDHRPERAWSSRAPVLETHRPEPGAAAEARAPAGAGLGADAGVGIGVDTGTGTGTGADAGAGRPLWLLDPPPPVDAGRFRLLSGPERIECGWWDEDRVARDYFVAVRQDGAQCWLYRCREADPDPGRWFLHGYFA